MQRLLAVIAAFGCMLGLPGSLAAQTHFVTLATDGAWTWYNDPRALFHNGQLYFGYVRSDGKTALSRMNLATGVSSNLWVSDFTQVDDHNNPALLSKQDGTLLAVYARHGSDQYFAYRWSLATNPVAAADWVAEQRIPNSGASMTYANPFQLSEEGGRIYNFCRNLNYNPTIYVSSDGGSTWSAPQWFIRTGTGGTRPYVKYGSDYTRRIDFLYTDAHPRNQDNSLYHLYYQSNAFYRTEGTLVKTYAGLPILHDSGERGSIIYQYSAAAQSDPNQWIPTGRAWCWETAYQTNGDPVCVFTVQQDFIPAGQSTDPDWSDDRIYYYYARWTGSSWQKRFIAQAGRPLYSAEDDYAGGICVDPQNSNVIYISSNAQDPFNLADTTNVPLRANSRYELWRGVTSDGGLTFDWTQVTTNSAQDNLRPYIPRRNGGEECVIWFQGTYSTYTSFSCSVVGWFSTETIPPPEPPKITYVDATFGAGGNTTFANGATFNPSGSQSGTDGLWRLRTGLANPGGSGTVVEAGGDISTTGSAAGGNNEDCARLATTISGLAPGRRYNVHAYFWSAGSQSWRIRASLTNEAGDLPLFAQPSAPTAVASDFVTAPLLTESDRILKQASLGETVASGSGTIAVYLDDDPAARFNLASAWDSRSWHDGVGHAPVINTTPTNLSYGLTGDLLELSWPLDYIGWRLETNGVGLLDSNAWFTLPGSALTNRAILNPTATNVLFRLTYP